MTMKEEDRIATAVSLLAIALFISPWIYHIVYCFKNDEYLLLIAGTIVAPVGWLHGFGVFAGWW